MKILRALQVIGLIILIAGMLFLGCLRCTSTKDINKHEQESKSDSTVQKRYDSLSMAFERMEIKYKREATELKKIQIKFKNVPCPDVVIPENCPKDSLLKLLLQYKGQIASYKNKITVLADGRTEYEGQIESMNTDMENLEIVANQVTHDNLVLTKVAIDQAMALVKSHVELAKSKHVERKFMNQWWLFLAGMLFMAGIFYRRKIKKVFVSAAVLAMILPGCYVYKYECPCCKKPPEWPQKPIIWNPEPHPRPVINY